MNQPGISTRQCGFLDKSLSSHLKGSLCEAFSLKLEACPCSLGCALTAIAQHYIQNISKLNLAIENRVCIMNITTINEPPITTRK